MTSFLYIGAQKVFLKSSQLWRVITPLYIKFISFSILQGGPEKIYRVFFVQTRQLIKVTYISPFFPSHTQMRYY